jgi:hypothetical protein
VSIIEALLPSATQKTAAWLTELRDKHLPSARALTAQEREDFLQYYDPELLDAVRVKEVAEMEKPAFYDTLRSKLAFVGMRVHFDFANVAGLTADTCILVRQGQLTTSLLFHEMVHVEQYRQLGMERFARAYLLGLVESGFVYEQAPFEAIAFELEQRYCIGEKFFVRTAVEALISEKSY